ncbi:hypothetical protein D3C72_2201790 [compost metagenome]
MGGHADFVRIRFVEAVVAQVESLQFCLLNQRGFGRGFEPLAFGQRVQLLADLGMVVDHFLGECLDLRIL